MYLSILIQLCSSDSFKSSCSLIVFIMFLFFVSYLHSSKNTCGIFFSTLPTESDNIVDKQVNVYSLHVLYYYKRLHYTNLFELLYSYHYILAIY